MCKNIGSHPLPTCTQNNINLNYSLWFIHTDDDLDFISTGKRTMLSAKPLSDSPMTDIANNVIISPKLVFSSAHSICDFKNTHFFVFALNIWRTSLASYQTLCVSSSIQIEYSYLCGFMQCFNAFRSQHYCIVSFFVSCMIWKKNKTKQIDFGSWKYMDFWVFFFKCFFCFCFYSLFTGIVLLYSCSYMLVYLLFSANW